MFTGGTQSAVGGRLYPWQCGPNADSEQGFGIPQWGILSFAENRNQAQTACSPLASFAPYRGLIHRLHLRVMPASFHHSTFGSPTSGA
jgi:hypothetical protein